MIIQDIDHSIQGYLDSSEGKESGLLMSLSKKIEDINQKYNYLIQNDGLLFNSEYKNTQENNQLNKMKLESIIEKMNSVLAELIESSQTDIRMIKEIHSSNH